MCTYLQSHQGTYYFRRGVPAEIRHLFPTASGKPRTEWRWSLRVKSREAAKRLLPESVAKTNRLIDQARKAIIDAASRGPVALSGDQMADSKALADQLEEESLEASEFFARLDAEEDHRAETDAEFAQVLALRVARGRELALLREADEDRELLKQLAAQKRISLSDLFEQWAAVPGRNAKTVAQWRPYIRHLAGFLGDDNALSVDHERLVAWRNHLRDNETFRGQRLSAKTINGSYLGSASALFAWAKGDGIIDRNPMLEVTKVKLPKVPKLREKEFSLEEARTILRATLDQSTSREGPALRDAKRWVPWLLAYSGARVNEITQLRKEDVTEIEGIALLRLTPEAGPIKAKAYRLVPLHKDVISQGFLEFVGARSDGPLFYDPSRRRSEAAINRQSNRLGSKLAEWVRTLGIRDKTVKPNHAWRHLFNTLAIRHELDPRATRAILGHAAGNVNETYGSVPVDALHRELNKLPLFLKAS